MRGLRAQWSQEHPINIDGGSSPAGTPCVKNFGQGQAATSRIAASPLQITYSIQRFYAVHLARCLAPYPEELGLHSISLKPTRAQSTHRAIEPERQHVSIQGRSTWLPCSIARVLCVCSRAEEGLRVECRSAVERTNGETRRENISHRSLSQADLCAAGTGIRRSYRLRWGRRQRHTRTP